jgi:hypothetical protein
MTELFTVVTADEVSQIVTIGTEAEVKKYLGVKKFYRPDLNVMNYIMPNFFKGCVKSSVVHADYEKRLIVEKHII